MSGSLFDLPEKSGAYAYVSYEDESRVIIRADSSAGRRSRGAQVAAVKRAWEKANGSAQGKLTRYRVTYDECPGFLARTEVAYYTSYGMKHSLYLALGGRL